MAAAVYSTIDQLPAAVALSLADEIELDQAPHGLNASTKATLAQLVTLLTTTTVQATRTAVGSTAVAGGDYTVRVDASGGASVVTLPNAATTPGRIIVITKIDSTVNAVSFTGATLNGQGSLTIQFDHVMLQTNGVSWDPIG